MTYIAIVAGMAISALSVQVSKLRRTYRHILLAPSIVIVITTVFGTSLHAQSAERIMDFATVHFQSAANFRFVGESTLVEPAVQNATFCCDRRLLLPAGAEVIALLIVPNYFNRHVADDTTAALSWGGWSHNVRTGLEWDNNDFLTNMFMHPFHGNVYFNAARSNGYDFWESAAFSMIGAFLWEMFGENNRGAVNDWAATGFGGIALGEAFHRTATMIRDNRTSGPGRSLREIGAFFVDPVGGLNRAARGEMSKVGSNPPDRIPDSHGIQMTAGMRQTTTGRFDETSKDATPYVDIIVQYGSPFVDYDKPYASFELGVQYNASESVPIGRLNISGTLWGTSVKHSEKLHHVLTLSQTFDYLENNAYELGGLGVGLRLHSRFGLSENGSLVTRVGPTLNLLNGINSEYQEFTGRTYDFGSGGGFGAQASYVNRDHTLAWLGYSGTYTRTFDGAKGNQVVHFLYVGARLPLWSAVGIGADYWVNIRNSFYSNFPDVNRIIPELRFSATFTWR